MGYNTVHADAVIYDYITSLFRVLVVHTLIRLFNRKQRNQSNMNRNNV